MNILLVDDHAVVRQGYTSLLAMMLGQAEVRGAESGEDAIAAAQQRVPDLVIMDIRPQCA